MMTSIIIALLSIYCAVNSATAMPEEPSAVYTNCSFSFSDRRLDSVRIKGSQTHPLPYWWDAGDVVEPKAKTGKQKHPHGTTGPHIRLLKLDCEQGIVEWRDVRNKSLIFVFVPPPPSHICESNGDKIKQEEEAFEVCIDVPQGDHELVKYEANDECVFKQMNIGEGKKADGREHAGRHTCCFATPIRRSEFPTYIYMVPNATHISHRFNEKGELLNNRKCRKKDSPCSRLDYDMEQYISNLYGDFNEAGSLSTTLYYSITKISSSQIALA